MPFNITNTSFSFFFWKSATDEKELPDPNFCTISLDTGEDGLPALIGECNHRRFEVDLRSYRIFSIVMDVGI